MSKRTKVNSELYVHIGSRIKEARYDYRKKKKGEQGEPYSP